MNIEELKNACELIGAEHEHLTGKLAIDYINEVTSIFRPSKKTGHLAIHSDKSVTLNTEAYEFTLSEKFDQKPIYLFFDQKGSEKDSVFILRNGRRLGEVLEECFGMEYFVSNKERTFLISVNWYSIEIVGELKDRFK